MQLSQISSLFTKNDIFSCPGQCWTPVARRIDLYQTEPEGSSVEKETRKSLAHAVWFLTQWPHNMSDMGLNNLLNFTAVCLLISLSFLSDFSLLFRLSVVASAFVHNCHLCTQEWVFSHSLLQLSHLFPVLTSQDRVSAGYSSTQSNHLPSLSSQSLKWTMSPKLNIHTLSWKALYFLNLLDSGTPSRSPHS